MSQLPQWSYAEVVWTDAYGRATAPDGEWERVEELLGSLGPCKVTTVGMVARHNDEGVVLVLNYSEARDGDYLDGYVFIPAVFIESVRRLRK